MKGLIIKGIGGFYYVMTQEGEVVEAKGRGIFKKDKITLLVGDEVEIQMTDRDGAKGVINSIFPRKNQFARPPISNVDMFIVVFAAKNPRPNYSVIDKFLINSQLNGIEPVICINKKDLVSERDIDEIRDIYGKIYRTVAVSARTGEGTDDLRAMIKGRRAALAGPSGAGKSSIINLLHPKADMETGEVSRKTMRGRHTTRHVEIFSLAGGGMLFDTPGFTSFDLPDIEEDRLKYYYPEFAEFNDLCRYDDCRHLKEPDCAVLAAVAGGRINNRRYEAYVSNYEELKRRKRY